MVTTPVEDELHRATTEKTRGRAPKQRGWIGLPLLVVVTVVVLLAPAVSAAPWLQPRGDAEATGYQPEDGPAWPDVALRAELQGSMRAEADSPPLILEDHVLFLARPYEDPTDDDYRIFSVNVHTGELTLVAEGIALAPSLRMASDGQTLYVSSLGTVHAFPLGPEGNEWTWTGEGKLGGTDQAEWEVEFCANMALELGFLTVLCYGDRMGNSCDVLLCGNPRGNTLAARIDVETGEHDWVWAPDDPVPQDPQEDPRSVSRIPVGLAVSGPTIIVLTSGGCCFQNDPGPAGYWLGWAVNDLWAIDAEGELMWHKTLQSTNETRVRIADQQVDAEDESPFQNVGNPAILDGAVYVKAGDVQRLNLGTGEIIWKKGIGQEDVDPNGGRSGAISLSEEHVHTTSAQTLYRMDQNEPEDGWSKSLDFGSEEGFDEQPIATPSAIYTVIRSPEAPETIIAFDTEDGDQLWRHTSGEEAFSFSVSQGLLAYTETEFHNDGANTSLVVLGETKAAPSATAEPASTYPAPSEQVEVDLSGSEAGVQGPVTRYKALWGDQTETDWQEDPVLRHTYDEPGDVTARFIVANNANQTASTTQTFHVGQEVPTEPNWISERFEPGNQDMTFGILGILVAATGGAVGVTQRYRKRSRLQDELEAVEQAYEATRNRPLECEAQLTERKTHARGLVLDGELDEQQFGVVEQRIEELLKGVRMGAMEDEFDFLPHGLVKRAREMLADGTVSSLEREAFLQAVEEDEMLSSRQKAVVRDRIEAWHARDKQGGGADR